MLRYIYFLGAFTFFSAAMSAQTVLFSEDFQNGMPANFTLFDMDGRTPAPSTAYVTAAWVARADFLLNGASDTAAFSTSWYSPNGAADDWLITPAISLTSASILSWESAAYSADYPDGYEVRLFNAAPTTATLASSILLFSTAAEQPARTQRQLSLATYTGQTVYIAFRNTTNDGTLLLIDNIEVRTVPNNDLALVQRLPALQYSKIPFQQYQAVADTLRVENAGLLGINTPSATRHITRGNDPNPQASAQTNSVSLLPSGADTFLRFSPFVPALSDIYYFDFVAAADQNAQNDTLRYALDLRNSYARHRGNMVRDLGYGEAGAYLGFMVDINTAQDALSVSAYMAAGYLENRLAAVLFATDANGVPTTAVAFSDTVSANNQAQWYTLPFPSTVSLPAGRYLVALAEFNQPLKLGFTQGIFSPSTVWASAPSQSWQPLEAINANFAVVPMLELNMSPAFDCSLLSVNIDSMRPVSFGASSDGALGVLASGGTAPYAYLWNTGATSAFIENLSADTFNLTVTDANLCTATLQAIVPIATGVEARVGETLGSFSAYPNPTNGILQLQYSSTEDSRYALYSALGQLLLSGNLAAGEHLESVDISQLPEGIYYLQISNSKGLQRRESIRKASKSGH